jgi:hypothetical protein
MFNRREVMLHGVGTNVRSKMRDERETISLAIQIIANATTVMLPLYSIRTFWSAIEAREKKLRGVISWRIPKLKIDTTQRSIASKKHRRNWSRSRPVMIIWNKNARPWLVIAAREHLRHAVQVRAVLTRAIDEHAKPNGERIAAFRDSAKESLELELFSSEPVYDDYQILG